MAIKKIKELKNKFKFSKVKQVLKDPKVISYLNILQEQYVLCPTDKAANNITYIYIYKEYYVQVLLKELSLLNTTLSTYREVNDTLYNVLQQQNHTQLNSIKKCWIKKMMMRNLIVFHVFIGSRKSIKYHLMQDL